jgi:hypothetical protein
VSILSRILLVLITVRLLMPPGICICHLSSPAAYLLTVALGGEPPMPSTEPHDDHDPGCPASALAPALGLQPAGPEIVLDTSLPDLEVTSPSALTPLLLDHRSLFSFFWAAAPPLYLSHCALLF